VQNNIKIDLAEVGWRARRGTGGGNGPWSSTKFGEFLEYLRTC
jgi:hypothetical protein